jgi:hypothetical protein
MTLNSEYNKGWCPQCLNKKLRNKLDGDWKAGEKLARGYFPDIFHYYYCESCRRTWVEQIEEKEVMIKQM